MIISKHIYGQGIKSPEGGKIAAVCAVDGTILYAKNPKDMQETTDMYVDWLNYVKMEAIVEKCIHIRSIPKDQKTEALGRQIEKVQWEVTEWEKYTEYTSKCKQQGSMK